MGWSTRNRQRWRAGHPRQLPADVIVTMTRATDDGDGGWRQRTVSVILCVFIFALSSRLKIWICSFAIYSQERMAVSDSVVIKEGIRVVRAM